MKVHAVILAAGLSVRFESDCSKVLARLKDKPIILYLLETFIKSEIFETITLLVSNKDKTIVQDILNKNNNLGVVEVVEGGETRHHSEEIALDYLKHKEKIDQKDLISIHDAARPFVEKELLVELIDTAKEYKSSAPALKSKIIFDKDSNSLAQNQDTYYLMQTPQTFLAQDLFFSYSKAKEDGWVATDTVECISKYTDIKAKIIEGTDLNMKITFLKDLEMIERIIEENDINI